MKIAKLPRANLEWFALNFFRGKKVSKRSFVEFNDKFDEK